MSRRVSKRIKNIVKVPKTSDELDILPKNQKFKQSRWQLEEKCALLEAIKEHGLSDFQKLANSVRTRNFAEVQYFVNNRRKALLGNYNKRKQQEKNDVGTMVINQWCDKLNEAVDIKFRGKNYSTVLEEVMDTAAKSEESSNLTEDEPDFSKIYSYISHSMAECIPASLPPVESFLVLDAMQNLSETIKKNLWNDETTLLKNLHLRKTVPVDQDLQKKSVAELWKTVREEAEKAEPCTSSTEKNSVPAIPLWEESTLPGSELPPILDIQEHSHPFLPCSLNPLSIPTAYLNKETKLIFDK